VNAEKASGICWKWLDVQIKR